MTRSDYLRLAAALNDVRYYSQALPSKGSPAFAAGMTKYGAFLLGVDAAARYIADTIAKGNPKFDVDQFLRNAGAAPIVILSNLN
jgi:hypothetical protein